MSSGYVEIETISEKISPQLFRIRTYSALAAILWTLMLLISAGWYHGEPRNAQDSITKAEARTSQQQLESIAMHGSLWLISMTALFVGTRRLWKSAVEQKRIEEGLHEQTLLLENEIAERQLLQEALQRSEAHLRVVADYSADWEYWRLSDNSFLYISPSVLSHTGYTVDEFMNTPELLIDRLHEEDALCFEHHTHDIDEQGHVHPIEIRFVTKSGDERWFSHVCRQVYDHNGLPWGWRASNRDITQQKLLELALQEQSKRLKEEIAEREAAQEQLLENCHTLEIKVAQSIEDLRRKDQAMIQQGRQVAMGEMINNIAHQWRQPLNNVGLIIQNIQMAIESGDFSQEEIDRDITNAMHVIVHMSRTIDDFRNFFRQDKEIGTIIINKAVAQCLELVSATIENRGIKIHLASEGMVITRGYPNEYAQTLLNILANAQDVIMERKVAGAEIFISIRMEEGRSVVTIRDNAGGIAADILPKIFDPYFTSKEPGKGTGIGLYMSRVIIEEHMKGRLTASNTDTGAEFRIEL